MISPDWPQHPTELQKLIPYAVLPKDAKVPHFAYMTNDTGLAKLGASIGDFSQTGCNCVTNPGTLMGRHTLIYANRSVAKG